MLTQLTTVKARLGILDVASDALLTATIGAVSARFDRLCDRTFARTENATFEFEFRDTELVVPCYPVESVSKFETKESEAAGWVEQTGVDCVVRNGCVISLTAGMESAGIGIGRVTYTGGYALPGSVPQAGQTALPFDVEHAAVEQVAVWFQNREKLGLIRHWPSGGTYLVFTQLPLLPQVVSILRPYQRWSV